MNIDKALENLDKIFDKNRKIETDDDLLELAELAEDESNEEDIIAHNIYPVVYPDSFRADEG